MENDSKNVQKAALLAAISAACLALVKLTMFFLTGSLVIAMSAWDSSMDVMVSLLNRKIIKFARQDADDDHPYGHGRAESIAAFGQGSLILGGGVVVIISSIQHVISYFEHPTFNRPLEQWRYVVFFFVATVISYAVAKGLKKQGAKFNSPALLADSEHYMVDCVTNIASAVALSAVIVFQQPLLDPCIASLFALYIIYGGVKLLRTSIDELMDHDISDSVKKHVVELIHKMEEKVIDVHNLRGRKCGPSYYFDCHVTLPSNLTFHEVHDILQKIEHALENIYGGDTIIHADPQEESS